MASSSSPSPSHLPASTAGWTYDVFLSFRGEDTRYSFVDHLYAALVRSGLSTFKDDEMLREGKEISPELLEAIKESRCAVVVFSKFYANSSWCLVELTKIIECRNQKGQLVIPVFYHVDPSDVRKLKGNYRTAFLQHEQKIVGTFSTFYTKLRTILMRNPSSPHEENIEEEMDKVNKWKEALKAVSSISGHHITGTQGESSIIDQIVQSILNHKQPPVDMENYPIGINHHMKELERLLDLKSTQEVRIIGIRGMGGIGKTTIARTLFRKISFTFHGSSFVKNVRESFSSICALQERILKDIMKHKSISQITDPENGAEEIKTRCCNKKVLLVLDDVDDIKQLKFLAAARTWFGSGSRIIITTRDEHVLDFHTNVDIYRPHTLPKPQALELFSRHAFRAKTPPEGYKELSARAIGYAGGLPLALEVLGSLLRRQQACLWGSALDRLAERPETEMYKPLKISFDGLCDFDKEIFLDIACFYKGNKIESVTRKLDSCGLHPKMGINVLTKRSLITISKGCIEMHDVLQEMGREIVRVSYPNSRLWKREEICGLKGSRNLGAVKGIVQKWYLGYEDAFLSRQYLIHINRNPDAVNVNFSGDVFENMNNIRLLETQDYFTSYEPTTFPDKLRWLSWDHYPFSSLPVANMHKLVGLEMHQGKIEHLWTEYEHLPNLKFIYLNYMKIKNLPDVSGAINLERLIVTACDNLVEIHKSLGTLKKLAYLNLSYCRNLRYLPSMEEMPSVETIDLTGCTGLERFPKVSSSMVKLTNIYLNGCLNLKTIPHSICELKNLKILRLQDCRSLQHLPELMGSMGKLEELLLGNDKDHHWLILLLDSINLQYALTKLCCLRKLDLSWRQMEEHDFPLNFHEFSSLEELHLSHNHKLVQLPGSISGISSLKHLELNECKQLDNIQGLPSTIQVLKAGNCSALERIEDLSKECASLHTIYLPGCKRLLKNHENVAYLDNMLQQSFVKKCIAVDGQLCILIPGSKISSWFEEQHHDGYELGRRIPSEYDDGIEYRYEISLKLPPQRHTSIMGFVVCVVFKRTRMDYSETPTDRSEDGEGASPIDLRDDETISMVYIPESVFWRKMNDDDFGKGDWSLLIENGRYVSIIVNYINLTQRIERCGGYIVHKEDKEPIQQIKTPFPHYCVDSSEDYISIDRKGELHYRIEFKVTSTG